MNPIPAPAMMGAQVPAGGVEDRIAHGPAQRRLQDIDRRGDRERRVPSFQKIDQRFVLGRNFFAQVVESVASLEPDGIAVRTGDTTPNVSFTFSECESRSRSLFI